MYCIGRRHGIRIDSVHVKSYCLCIKHLESGQALYIEKKDKETIAFTVGYELGHFLYYTSEEVYESRK